MRKTLLVDRGNSMAVWEPTVENYLGFDAIPGEDLLARGHRQAQRFGVQFADDEIEDALSDSTGFVLQGKKTLYRSARVLVATGLFHIPPDIPCVRECLGHSMFFCKDCDGVRVQGKRVAVVGWNDEAVEYALGLLYYSPRVALVTNGREPVWSEKHALWLREYEIPFFTHRIVDVKRTDGFLNALEFDGGEHLVVEALFTTRGDIVHNRLGKALGAQLDADGQIVVDNCCRTSVRGLYAAGCVTPANCQMIIAAGQGATAAQSINRDLFEESLGTHKLRRFREKQIKREETEATVVTPQSGQDASAG